MDRNFGAKGYTREHGWALFAGNMYQFGRKDLFPTSDNVYDITGAVNRTIARLSGVIPIYETVVAPMSFVKQTGDSVYDWSAEDRYRSYDWNDILLAGSGMRNYSTGNHSGSGHGALWSSRPSGSGGVYLYYDNVKEKYTLPSQGFYRYMGMPVRCITVN